MEFYVLMDIVIFGFGGYILFQYALMKKNGALNENMLLPKDLNIKRCKDPAGYIAYIGPKQIAFGATVLLCGIIGLIQDVTGMDSMILYIGAIVICLGCIIWYTSSMKKAIRMFWK